MVLAAGANGFPSSLTASPTSESQSCQAFSAWACSASVSGIPPPLYSSTYSATFPPSRLAEPFRPNIHTTNDETDVRQFGRAERERSGTALGRGVEPSAHLSEGLVGQRVEILLAADRAPGVHGRAVGGQPD